MAANTKKFIKRVLLILVAGVFLGIAIQLLTRSTQTTYYIDACASVGGCCPDEGYVEGSTKYCPSEVQSFGFPIRTADHTNTSSATILLLNIGILSGAVLIIALPSSAMVQKMRQKLRN